jgi:hypothetical protein
MSLPVRPSAHEPCRLQIQNERLKNSNRLEKASLIDMLWDSPDENASRKSRRNGPPNLKIGIDASFERGELPPLMGFTVIEELLFVPQQMTKYRFTSAAFLS